MKRCRMFFTAAVLLFCIASVSSVQASEVKISVAASMTDLFKTLIVSFNQQHPDVSVVTNFASSGSLAKQIEQGAPADLFVSANPKWMSYLQDKGMINTESKKVFAYNSLVFVGMSEGKITSLKDVKNLKRVGIGSPKSVPAGQYAEQALTKAGLYDEMVKAGQFVMAKDVRQALMYADRGETDGSFVYKTDALLATQARILFEVPQDLYKKVTYPIALTTVSEKNKDAKAFYDYLVSAAAHPALQKYGFTLP